MKTIMLQLGVPATVYPTLTVLLEDWQKAKAAVESGQPYNLVGGLGGFGCRGGSLPGGLGHIKLIGKQEGVWQAEDRFWGNIWVTEGRVIDDGCSEGVGGVGPEVLPLQD